MFDIDLGTTTSGFDIQLSPPSAGVDNNYGVKISNIFGSKPIYVKISSVFVEKPNYVKIAGTFS